MPQSKAICAALLLLFTAAPILGAAESAKPNIILIMVDDFGVGNVSIQGADEPYAASVPETNTTNLHELAQSGLTFTQGYSAGNMCWPSRGSLLTGRYHQRWNSGVRVPPSERKLPQRLKQLGYHTAAVGKWHNGPDPGNFPPADWGFDEHYVTYTSHDYYETQGGPGLRWETVDQWREAHKNMDTRGDANRYAPLLDSRLGSDEDDQFVVDFGYLTSAYNRRALQFIDENHDRPFFLYVAHSARHVPSQTPPERYMQRFDGDSMTEVNTAIIDVVDQGVGKIRRKLQDLDILENTILVFVSDNGGPHWATEYLNGHKGQNYEGGIRIPFLMSWPKALPSAAKVDFPVTHLDLAPTLIAAAGGQVPADMDGQNVLEYLTNEEKAAPQRTLFWGSLRDSSYAARQDDDRDGKLNHRWKLITDGENTDPQLYDLLSDPQETNDVALEHEKIVRQLSGRIERWVETLSRD